MSAGGVYELRTELHGHTKDVQCVLPCELGIATASADNTVRIWRNMAKEGNAIKCSAKLVLHTDIVMCLAFISPGMSQDYPNGALVSGSMDTTIIVWNLKDAKKSDRLTGHKSSVHALGVLPTGELMSGSADMTLKVWRGRQCVATLEGHNKDVMSLAVLPTGEVLSGSGDSNVKLWSIVEELRTGQAPRCVHTYKGHTDTVRALAVLPDVGFVSASNDFTLRVWALSGELLAELLGHTAWVYAVATTSEGLIASGSEDSTCRMWNSKQQSVQVLQHAAPVLSVAFSANGELLTGHESNLVYGLPAAAAVFTTDQHLKAAPAVEAQYTKIVKSVVAGEAASRRRAALKWEQEEGWRDVYELPPEIQPGIKVETPALLDMPGSEGQHKFIREPSRAVALYVWSMQKYEWEKVRDVVAADWGKKLHRGKLYDFVIETHVMEDDYPFLLAFNRDDDPYQVAEAFIADNNFIPTPLFRSNIVNLITSLPGTDFRPMPALPDTPETWSRIPPNGTESSPAGNTATPAGAAAVPAAVASDSADHPPPAGTAATTAAVPTFVVSDPAGHPTAVGTAATTAGAAAVPTSVASDSAGCPPPLGTAATTAGAAAVPTAVTSDSAGRLPKVCTQCANPPAPGKKLQLCGRCRRVRYCSSECQVQCAVFCAVSCGIV